MKKLILILTFSVFAMTVFSQTESHEGHSHHEHPKNEIGVANSPVYFVKEKEFTYGLHLHFVHTIGDSKFGIGIGYEQIFDEHKHKTIGVVGSYRPIHGLSINLSPGVTIEERVELDGEVKIEKKFSAHLESTYEWEFGNLHLGPVLEFAYDPEDVHISLGIHVGYGF